MSDSRAENKLIVKKGRLYPMGLHKMQKGLSIVSDIIGKRSSGIVIYPKGGKGIRIPFRQEYRIGDLYCLLIEDFPYDEFAYHFYRDDERVTDEYAKLLDSSKRFGDPEKSVRRVNCLYRDQTYDWEGDVFPEIPFHETIIYKLHVRGFTKHRSSQVSAKGTFLGVTEKIPYLKELGITAVECMPIYEFEDVIFNAAYQNVDRALLPFMEEKQSAWKYKTNYWGYSEGSYMAPKRAYSYSGRPDTECKDMIRALHQNGMEVILEFYFPPKIRPGYILEVCRYWAEEYHVDGFKLMGCNLPVGLLATDPYLKRTKLIFENPDQAEFNRLEKKATAFQNIGAVSPGFLYDIRKFLKGDEGMLAPAAEHFTKHPSSYEIVNEITSYQGFTLADLVSYDRKHNEENGEDNRDGSDYNYSWNCGAEGRCRRKNVLTLREQQSKNALMMLLLSQGTPVLLAGDEFGNSADGNNNPYCQDNAVSWLNWKQTAASGRLYRFVRDMISFRRSHPILHMSEALRQMDYISCGYPDLSYHGEQAWYPRFENYNRHMGIMYCGKYKRITRTKEDSFIYAAYNAHWVEHDFALPLLPAGMRWRVALTSNRQQDSEALAQQTAQKEEQPAEPGQQTAPYQIRVKPRTIVVLVGEKG